MPAGQAWCSLNAMTESDNGIPGENEGFLSGCPFCTSNRIGIPEIGTRFRIISGLCTGAKGTVIESTLDKGRGCVTTVLVQDGTLKKGDIMLAGPIFGKVKAMSTERNKPINIAGPSTPVVLLGLKNTA